MGTIAPTGFQASIFVIFLDLIPETGEPNHGSDEPPAHPIDSFAVRGSKIAIGRWGPSSLPGFKLEHLDLRLDLMPKTGQQIVVGMSLRLIRSIRLRFGAVKLLLGDGDHSPYRYSRLNIQVSLLPFAPQSLIAKPNLSRH